LPDRESAAFVPCAAAGPVEGHDDRGAVGGARDREPQTKEARRLNSPI
jgi:hypothetical protein